MSYFVPHFLFIYVCVVCLCVCMHASMCTCAYRYMCMCVQVHVSSCGWHWVSPSNALSFICWYCISRSFWSSSVLLATVGIPFSAFISLSLQGSNHTHPALPWILKVWTLILKLAQQVFCLLNHLSRLVLTFWPLIYSYLTYFLFFNLFIFF